jgi:hypothetical protein
MQGGVEDPSLRGGGGGEILVIKSIKLINLTRLIYWHYACLVKNHVQLPIRRRNLYTEFIQQHNHETCPASSVTHAANYSRRPAQMGTKTRTGEHERITSSLPI